MLAHLARATEVVSRTGWQRSHGARIARAKEAVVEAERAVREEGEGAAEEVSPVRDEEEGAAEEVGPVRDEEEVDPVR